MWQRWHRFYTNRPNSWPENGRQKRPMYSHFSFSGDSHEKLSPRLADGYVFTTSRSPLQSTNVSLKHAGQCGISQPAANPFGWMLCLFRKCPASTTRPSIAHQLCNDFYISAFENDFVAEDNSWCNGAKKAATLPPRFKMGYTEGRKRWEAFQETVSCKLKLFPLLAPWEA